MLEALGRAPQGGECQEFIRVSSSGGLKEGVGNLGAKSDEGVARNLARFGLRELGLHKSR